jgi:TetR/AcrR family transcriptional regulator, transcriptional repressor for nem operon
MQPLLDAQPTGRAKIAAMLRYYAETSHGAEGLRGCLVAGGAMEIATYDAAMAERITSGLVAVADRVRGLILLGRSDGSIASDVDIDATTDVLVAVLQGFRVIGKSAPDRARMIASAERALRLLD